VAKIFCFIPAFGKMISAATFETSHHLAMALLSKGHQFNIGTFSWPDIEQMRNIALSYWYDLMPDSEYLLFVDSDMGFAPQVVLDMMAFGEPIIGAVYPKRTYPIEWVVSGIESPEKRGEFWECDGLGGGCLLIRREAITKMIEAYPELIGNYMALLEMQAVGAKRTLRFFDKIQTEKGPASEDISFCRRWRAIGGRVWGAVGHEITHVGQHPFTAGFLSHNAAVEERNMVEAQRSAPTSIRKHLMGGDDQSAA
jgi:hypothetical protein